MKNTFFTLTIDTEADNAWTEPEKISLNNMKEIPRFQELCEKYNIVPTYLITYECAVREEALKVLKQIHYKNSCEIGHHLHVWSTPPFQKTSKEDVDLEWIHAYQFELPDSLFEDKATALKEAIEKNFGTKPLSHRAGRWGIDQRSITWLAKNKFMVDTSVVPLRDYSSILGKNIGGVNFSKYPQAPYNWKANEKESLFEIPLSVFGGNFRILRNMTEILFNNTSSRIKTLINNYSGAGKMLRFSPYYSFDFYNQTIKHAINAGIPVLNMMMHSSELSLNCSPYTSTKEHYQKMWKAIEFTFKLINKAGLKSVKLSEAANILSHIVDKKTYSTIF